VARGSFAPLGSSHHSPLEVLKFLKLLFSRREKLDPCSGLAAHTSKSPRFGCADELDFSHRLAGGH
jgi:hypothetical protein